MQNRLLKKIGIRTLRMRRNGIGILLWVAVLFVAGNNAWRVYTSAAPVMTASVSSDGAYALTAHRDQKLILHNRIPIPFLRIRNVRIPIFSVSDSA